MSKSIDLDKQRRKKKNREVSQLLKQFETRFAQSEATILELRSQSEATILELRSQLAAASGKHLTLPSTDIDISASNQTKSAISSGGGVILAPGLTEEQANFAAQLDEHQRGVENLNRRDAGDFNNNFTPNNKHPNSPSDSSPSGSSDSYSSPDNEQAAVGATESTAVKAGKRKRRREKLAAAAKSLAESNERADKAAKESETLAKQLAASQLRLLTKESSGTPEVDSDFNRSLRLAAVGDTTRRSKSLAFTAVAPSSVPPLPKAEPPINSMVKELTSLDEASIQSFVETSRLYRTNAGSLPFGSQINKACRHALGIRFKVDADDILAMTDQLLLDYLNKTTVRFSELQHASRAVSLALASSYFKRDTRLSKCSLLPKFDTGPFLAQITRTQSKP